MKFAIAVGHSQTAKGAVDTDGVPEWDWHNVYAPSLAMGLAALGYEVRLFQRPTGGYTTAITSMVSEINAWGADAALELHFDSLGTGRASGTSALHWPGSRRGEDMANRVSAKVAEAIGIRNRRSTKRTHSHSGLPLYFLQGTRCPSAILETHFGDNPEDVRKAVAARDSSRLASAIASALDVFARRG